MLFGVEGVVSHEVGLFALQMGVGSLDLVGEQVVVLVEDGTTQDHDAHVDCCDVSHCFKYDEMIRFYNDS